MLLKSKRFWLEQAPQKSGYTCFVYKILQDFVAVTKENK